MKNPLLEGLNPEQQKAVQTTEGPLLILAGAGSGKTKTLTHRIAYLIGENLATPYEILAVTFTNKAAGEMRQRVAELLGQNSQNRSFMPYMGTFHSICVRLLRQEGEHIGLPTNFIIFDESDRQSLIKQIVKQQKIDDKKSPIRSIAGMISGAKNELISPAEFSSTAGTPLQKIVAQVFPLYEKGLRAQNALDFDDLIGRTVALFANNPEIQQKWQTRFKYILVDEYQDTNTAQYKLIKLLTNANRNICVVGDDWQCLPAGSLVDTVNGVQKIENIKVGDIVSTAAGYGKVGNFPVTATRKFQYNSNLVEITTKTGHKITCTPNHILFARWSMANSFFVYLMYSKDIGYRIGVTQGTRNDGRKQDIGLRVRSNQERADKIWIIKVCLTRQEALYYESYYSYEYGIPMTIFRSSSIKKNGLTQENIKQLFNSIDTQKRASKLMAEKGISPEYPHFLPQATTRGGRHRLNINVVLFGDKRSSSQSPWSASRISANTTSADSLDMFEKNGYTVRKAKLGTHRSEVHKLDFGEIERVVNKLLDTNIDYQLSKYAFMTSNKFMFMPASQVYIDMNIPIIKNNKVIEDKIAKVKQVQYSGYVYDIDVDKVHNYSADRIISHNSIYSWRGADFRNILNFERDYPNCTVIKLEQNYRSTKNILDAAHTVISKNSKRSEKKLWTARGDGSPVQVVGVNSERAEAETIIRRIKNLVDIGVRSYNDFAVLYRTNAQSRGIEEQFVRFGLPYKIVGGVRFYDRAEVKDIMAYLRLIYQPEDIVSFRRIVNIPTRSIGAKSIESFLDWRVENGYTLQQAMENCENAPITPRARLALVSFSYIIANFRQASEEMMVANLLESLLKKIDYWHYLADGTIQAESRTENIKELLSVAKAYSEVGLTSFLEEVALVSDIDMVKEGAPAVTLMTLHAAKGLEFPIVFMPGMEETIFPHSRAMYDQSEMEEERRLCYVGMTRAKEELYLLSASSRVLYGSIQSNPPSRFIAEIDNINISNNYPQFDYSGVSLSASNQNNIDIDQEPRYTPELNEGDGVKHRVFGIGTVMEIDGDNVAVYFKGKGQKKLNISFAPLEKIE